MVAGVASLRRTCLTREMVMVGLFFLFQSIYFLFFIKLYYARSSDGKKAREKEHWTACRLHYYFLYFHFLTNY